MLCAKCGQLVFDTSELCPNCGQSPVAVSSAVAAEPSAPQPAEASLQGVGGWLMLFCIIVGVLPVLRFTMSGISILPFQPMKTLELALLAFSVTVASLIWLRLPSAIPVLRAYFVTRAALAVQGIIVAVLNRQNLDVTATVERSISIVLGVGIWATYFAVSKRVRATLGRNLF